VSRHSRTAMKGARTHVLLFMAFPIDPMERYVRIASGETNCSATQRESALKRSSLGSSAAGQIQGSRGHGDSVNITLKFCSIMAHT